MDDFREKAVMAIAAVTTCVIFAGAALVVLSVIAGAIWSLMGWM